MKVRLVAVSPWLRFFFFFFWIIPFFFPQNNSKCQILVQPCFKQALKAFQLLSSSVSEKATLFCAWQKNKKLWCILRKFVPNFIPIFQQVSYSKAIDYFLMTSLGFIFMSLLEFILVLNTDPRFWTQKRREQKAEKLKSLYKVMT